MLVPTDTFSDYPSVGHLNSPIKVRWPFLGWFESIENTTYCVLCLQI